jgi:diguanylate cyclase (GGDEF)-like protein
MAPRPRTPYAFTDPLGSIDAHRPPQWLARRALLVGYVLGAGTLGVTLLTPDSDTSDHTGIAVVAMVMVVMAALLKAWRRLPDAVLYALFPSGTVLISALVAIAKPIALIPIFYIWPFALSAYFLQRRDVVLNYVLVLVGFGVALVGWVTPDARLIQWVSIAVVGAVLAILVVALKEGLTAATARLCLLATRDPLTGALNRRAFSDALDGAVARSTRGEGPCAVAILDVDHFKTINDRFGHAAGDEALIRLVAIIEERMRRGDVLGRLGGEEFAVVLHGTDGAGAAGFGNDLRCALDEGRAGFTASIGVAELADGDGSAAAMLLAADRALYAAKAAGRDRVVCAGAPCA